MKIACEKFQCKLVHYQNYNREASWIFLHSVTWTKYHLAFRIEKTHTLLDRILVFHSCQLELKDSSLKDLQII